MLHLFFFGTFGVLYGICLPIERQMQEIDDQPEKYYCHTGAVSKQLCIVIYKLLDQLQRGDKQLVKDMRKRHYKHLDSYFDHCV